MSVLGSKNSHFLPWFGLFFFFLTPASEIFCSTFPSMMMFLPVKQVGLDVSSVCVEKFNAKPPDSDNPGFTSGRALWLSPLLTRML